ncbi:MAG: amidohydrolase, partial [Gemmatimonadota bacterium]|nr:amidohydrolase [Gemmatimonadota bacterium]
MANRTTAATLAALLTAPATLVAQGLSDDQLEPLVERVEAGVLERAKLAQVMVDKIFSFSE